HCTVSVTAGAAFLMASASATGIARATAGERLAATSVIAKNVLTEFDMDSIPPSCCAAADRSADRRRANPIGAILVPRCGARRATPQAGDRHGTAMLIAITSAVSGKRRSGKEIVMTGMRLLLLAGAIALGAASAAAEVYPSRPITVIVPFPAGGGVDAMARIVAERLTATLSQQVVIDNRGGAAGVIGTPPAAQAAARRHNPGAETHRTA